MNLKIIISVFLFSSCMCYCDDVVDVKTKDGEIIINISLNSGLSLLDELSDFKLTIANSIQNDLQKIKNILKGLLVEHFMLADAPFYFFGVGDVHAASDLKAYDRSKSEKDKEIAFKNVLKAKAEVICLGKKGDNAKKCWDDILDPTKCLGRQNKIENVGAIIDYMKQYNGCRAIIMTGDLVHTDKMGKNDSLLAFEKYWFNPLEKACFSKDCSIYLCVGNHDVYLGSPRFGGTTAAVDFLLKKHGNLFYSFDIDGVHFVCCGLAPYNTWVDEKRNINSLDFLKTDLALVAAQDLLKQPVAQLKNKNLKQYKTPIVIFFHYPPVGKMSNWWFNKEKDAFYRVIENFNVIGLVVGHDHETFYDTWHNIPVICCAGGEFAVCKYHPALNNGAGGLDVEFRNSKGAIYKSDAKEVRMNYKELDPNSSEILLEENEDGKLLAPEGADKDYFNLLRSKGILIG
ncbi:MAG: hypothetical protein UR26_C0001G0041 [candidate division TM6 bacterium GW2011_GWF2_32_72]|nr:MAG: hypothetical protein UR26_C0001G0041 [candidate division TM6 bacterium GW2011_GWF2_32_72]